MGPGRDVDLTADQELLLASTDFWCDAEEPTPECVDEEEFLNGGVPIFAEEDDEDDPGATSRKNYRPRTVLTSRSSTLSNKNRISSVDSHEAVPLINGKSEREAFAFVDERSCVGCNLCAATAPATFYMEEEHGMARIYRQHGDAPEVIERRRPRAP